VGGCWGSGGSLESGFELVEGVDQGVGGGEVQAGFERRGGALLGGAVEGAWWSIGQKEDASRRGGVGGAGRHPTGLAASPFHRLRWGQRIAGRSLSTVAGVD